MFYLFCTCDHTTSGQLTAIPFIVRILTFSLFRCCYACTIPTLWSSPRTIVIRFSRETIYLINPQLGDRVRIQQTNSGLLQWWNSRSVTEPMQVSNGHICIFHCMRLYWIFVTVFHFSVFSYSDHLISFQPSLLLLYGCSVLFIRLNWLA